MDGVGAAVLAEPCMNRAKTLAFPETAQGGIAPGADGRFVWDTGCVRLTFSVGPDGPVRLLEITGRGMTPAASTGIGTPIVEVLSSCGGRNMNHQRLTDTVAGSSLRFVSAERGRRDACETFRIVQYGRETGLRAESLLRAFDGVGAVEWRTRISSGSPLPVESVSSVCLPLPLSSIGATADTVTLVYADSTWAAENQWHRIALREAGVVDIDTRTNPRIPGARCAMSSRSSWSSGEHLPCGMVEMAGNGLATLMWQIENNGPWHWEIGQTQDGIVELMASGPNHEDHQWSRTLRDGVVVETVPVTVAIGAGDWQSAAAEMTLHRRALRDDTMTVCGRGPQSRHSDSLVIYNDYMNTLFGDPTAEKEIPLIDAVAELGVDVFCIDAGWYDSTDGGWWDTVGEWLPSTNRFGTEGLAGIANRIRGRGMALGLWLEPEVVGVHSPVAELLPDEAFFMRHGCRVSDYGRYHLDFRSPHARRHMDKVMERLIRGLGAQFFKFDYNTIPGAGTEVDAESIGEGLQGHCRAYLDWLEGVRRTYPDVTIENCGSGAMRADYAMLSRTDLQSTSDQCNPVIYAAIAAAAGLSILPEQQGNWGYAQQEMSDETAVFTLAAGIPGRLYLSGFVDRMDAERLGLVADAVRVHRAVLASQRSMVPFWPLGLPDFQADWQACGLQRTGRVIGGMPHGRRHDEDRVQGYLTLWRRGGTPSVDVAIPRDVWLKQVFPDPGHPRHAEHARPWRMERVDIDTIRLTVSDPTVPSARVYAMCPR